jgi:uncharacterized repeat protein (TIGR01451 family)
LTEDGFLDGVAATPVTSVTRQSPQANGNQQFYSLGESDSTNLGSGAFLPGVIDEFAVFSTALSNAQIQNLYTVGSDKAPGSSSFLPNDLSITKTDNVSQLSPGKQTTYTIVVSNNGPGFAAGATVTDNLPSGLTNATWTAVASVNSSVTASSGSGNINTTVSLIPGGMVTFTLTATVSLSALGSISNTATVTSPTGITDPNLSNNTATDTDSIASALVGAYMGPILVYGTDAGVPAEVRVYNPTTLALLYDFFPYGTAFKGGVHVAAGDVNGDGVQDIITGPGSGGGPLVNVYSGFNLSVLYSFNAYNAAFPDGVFVAAGDVNGDGEADIITAPDTGGGPLIHVYDGATGNLVIAFNAYNPGFNSGVRVAAGDINGDGKAEIITAPGVGGGPLVEAFNGTTGAVLLAFNAYNPAFRGGVFVAVSDINGDGKDEIITGPGVNGGSLVNEFNGTTGQMLLSFNTYNPLFIGGVRVGSIKDLNGDGNTEILTGGGPGGALLQDTNTGLAATIPAQVYDGAMLTVLDQIYPFGTFYFGGMFVAGSR